MNNKNLLSFDTFCTKTNLKCIREKIQKFLIEKHIKDPDQYLIILAVDEICANSMIHANNEDPCKHLSVKARLNKNELHIEITDEGKIFDYQKYQTPKIDDLVNLKSKGSMGLMLVNKIMDKIEYTRQGNKNVCRITKKMMAA
ncbi:MAG: ATP-binding protein [Bacteroidota bacterium]|nr:ATP-binding protein [Bacteroidota bacterium]